MTVGERNEVDVSEVDLRQSAVLAAIHRTTVLGAYRDFFPSGRLPPAVQDLIKEWEDDPQGAEGLIARP